MPNPYIDPDQPRPDESPSPTPPPVRPWNVNNIPQRRPSTRNRRQVTRDQSTNIAALRQSRAWEELSRTEYRQAQRGDTSVAMQFLRPPNAPRPGYWENPQHVAMYKNLVDTLPPGVTAPPWLDTPSIDAAYEYLTAQYGGDYTRWPTLLDYTDPASEFLRTFPNPRDAEDAWNAQQTLEATAQYPAQITTDPISNLTTTEAGLSVPGVTDSSRDAFNSQLGQSLQLLSMKQGAPGLARFFSSIAPGIGIVGGALPLALIGGVIGGGLPGFLIGGALGIGGSIAAMKIEEGRQMEAMEAGLQYRPGALMQILNVFDIPALWVEQVAGTAWQLASSAISPADYGTVESVIKNLPAAWEASRGFYESLVLPTKERTESGQRIFETYQKGEQGWQTYQYALPEGVESAPAFLISQASDQIAARLRNGERPKDIYYDIEQQYYDVLGSQAAVRDLVGHIMLDPLNLTNPAVKRV